VPYTLLLADDSVTIQRVIELTFADEDVHVIAVSDGDQAIERMEASPPDIVLADIGMPGKNGYEVAQYIRQSPRLSHIPVVLLTGAFEPVDQARATEAGCDGVLAKPFEPQLVIGRVKELLARAQRTPESVVTPIATAPAPSVDEWVPPPASQRPPAAAPAAAGDALGLNDYFDRLDAAFSTLSHTPAPAAKPSLPPAAPLGDSGIDWYGTASPAGAPAAEPWDLPVPPSTGEATDLPLSYTAPAAATPVSFDIVPAPAPEMPAPVTPPSVAPVAPVAPTASVEPPAPLAFPSSAPPAPSAPIAPFEPIAHIVEVAPAPPAAVAPSPMPAPAKPVELPALADAFAALLAAEESEAGPTAAPVWPASLPPAAEVNERLIEDVTRRVLDRLSDQVVRDTVADIVARVAEQLVREEIERIKASLK
jgi:CheY-like chemotaxis protein